MSMSTVVPARGPASRMRWSVTEERRIVTVLFVDIVGSTRLVDRLDPEDVRTLQRVYFGTVARVLRRWDGAVEKYVGDAVMALFGARSGDGWQAYRAVRAGLEIQRALDRRPLAVAPGLRVRVGVATGEAVVDLRVNHDGGHGVASGAVITLAARLQEYAPPGEVALCATTHRAVAGLIAQQRIPGVTVAGKHAPVDVWHATGLLRPPPPRTDDPLVGRRRELAAAREQLAEAVRGHGPRRLLLTGPPGAGRSRLLRELSRSTPTVDGMPVRWCLAACPPSPDDPLAPGAELVRGLAGGAGTDSPRPAIPRRGQRPPERRPTTDPATGPADPTAAGPTVGWREVLLGLARRQPVVVAVDDLDRAAPALRRQLDLLVDRATADGLPLVLVATATEEFAGPVPGAARVPLRPLDAVTTGRLLRRLLRRNGRPSALVRHLIPVVGGNPGYAVAYVRALDGDAATLPPVPESVRRVVDARLDRLDAPLRAALMAAAAVPAPCSATRLAYALGWSAGQAEWALAALTTAGLLVAPPTGGHRFTDPVLREVAIARLPRALRAAFARRAGTVPALDDPVEVGPVEVGPVEVRPAGRPSVDKRSPQPVVSRGRRPTAADPTATRSPVHTGESGARQEGQDPVPGEVGGDRVMVGHGRVGEQVPRPRVVVHHEVGAGGGQLPLPLRDLLGRVVGIRIGQVQLDSQAGPDRLRGAAGAVQQQQAGGVGAVREQRTGHPGTHRESREHGVRREPVERRAGPVEDGLLADPVEQGEALLDAVDGRHPVQVGGVHLVPGGAQPVGGGQHGRAQPVHGVKERDVCHPDILPDQQVSPVPARGRPVPARRVSPGRRSVGTPVAPIRRHGSHPGAGRGCGHGTRRPPPRPRGSP
ncbi:adenylyl cyclase class-3/4/guanylyl cyclase [Micromonospora zingiberis]|uniref:Adenylyl cyclase class-3/4/guanylyl cyclase n=1 Tax=Micromonospora zingiberis TaxID=2053011 RepID=A0A4R0GM20_9ACTN|nr:adenylyl cyclase class-3/4/guanylyl cyclase [Micromonospora zingiberis]